MQRNESTKTRLWAFALGLVVIAATLLVVRINPFEISLAYLGLLAGVIIVGLMTNLWGGVAASAVGVFAMILINQYAGIYPRENRMINIASELAVFLLVGPLAGMLSGAIEAVQRQANHWLARAEQQTVHDEALGTLKPEWGKLRLDEETLRAAKFGRPLSVVLLQLEASPESMAAKSIPRSERLGALQAVIRLVRATTQPPVVSSYLGNDQVLVILPEHTADQAYQVVTELQVRLASAVYFPAARGAQPLTDKSLGKPLAQWGHLHTGIASLSGAETGEALLALAKNQLETSEANRV